LTWGSPTPKDQSNWKPFPKDVQSIRLLVDDKPVPMEMPGKGRAIALNLLHAGASPFTEIP